VSTWAYKAAISGSRGGHCRLSGCTLQLCPRARGASQGSSQAVFAPKGRISGLVRESEQCQHVWMRPYLSGDAGAISSPPGTKAHRTALLGPKPKQGDSSVPHSLAVSTSAESSCLQCQDQTSLEKASNSHLPLWPSPPQLSQEGPARSVTFISRQPRSRGSLSLLHTHRSPAVRVPGAAVPRLCRSAAGHPHASPRLNGNVSYLPPRCTCSGQ